jgi:hypothetical protein
MSQRPLPSRQMCPWPPFKQLRTIRLEDAKTPRILGISQTPPNREDTVSDPVAPYGA